MSYSRSCFFFFNDTATTEIYTLSLHDALPISSGWPGPDVTGTIPSVTASPGGRREEKRRQTHQRIFDEAIDRKSTRLNSSHANISYAVFCLKKKKIYIT